ncbi:MAG: hypothetical protein F9K18_01365 [Thermoanaerobaculia bacterium]|nr:MAG: hypothetical protein F9K18_01365 [Thermoanaerobaculia bacterium]
MIGTRIRISSALTPLYKYVFPLVQILLAGGLFLPPESAPGPVFLIGFAMLSAGIFVYAAPSKHVDVDDRLIYIRGLRRRCVERLESIVAIEEHWVWAPGWVRLTFRQPTAFGRYVVFLPRGVSLPFLGPSKSMEILRERIGD